MWERAEEECSAVAGEGECIAGALHTAPGTGRAVGSCGGSSPHCNIGEQGRLECMSGGLGLHMLVGKADVWVRKARHKNFEEANHGIRSTQVRAQHSQLKGFSPHSFEGPEVHPRGQHQQGGEDKLLLGSHHNHTQGMGLGCNFRPQAAQLQ